MRLYGCCILVILMVILGSSCRKDLEYASSKGNLEFSKDTVFLDTIFANIGSSTRILKVYNRNRDAVEIPVIQLAQGTNSKYRINVDGVSGEVFTNIPIYEQDSIYIFIETTVDLSNTTATELLYTDILQFDTGDNLQEVNLVTLVKDAIFLFPKTLDTGIKETITLPIVSDESAVSVEGFPLKGKELHFTNEKPYVIYGYATVPPEKTLIIDPGARVYFHKDSGIFVNAGASIQINGQLSEDQSILEKEVIFEGDRLEKEFSTIPGQWGAIWLSQGSFNNTINHLTIKNATVGIIADGNENIQNQTLKISNSKIFNSSSINLWGKTANLTGENLVLGNAGNSSLQCNLGGSYKFTHCTIANYWTKSYRSAAALEIINTSSSSIAKLSQYVFTNCIIDGNTFLELGLKNTEANTFSFQFSNCLIKFRDTNKVFENNLLYNFQNTNNYLQIILNESVDFLDPNDNIFQIGPNSAAINKADLTSSLLLPRDILGIERTSFPSIGAYQFQ